MEIKIVLTNIFTIILLYITRCDTTIVINKCCPHGYQLNHTSNVCTISENKEEVLNKTLYPIFNDNITFDFDKEDDDININLQCNLSDIHTENISDTIKKLFTPNFIGKLDFCVDSTIDSFNVFLSCPCKHITCVNVCCQRGYMLHTFEDGRAVECVAAMGELKNWEVKEIMEKTEEQNFFVLYETAPLKKCSAENSVEYFSENITLLSNGYLTETSFDNRGRIVFYNFTPTEYCINALNNSINISIHAIICDISPVGSIIDNYVYCMLFFTGSLFLLATLFVYAMLPQLRKTVQSLSIMAHCSCMFIGYISFIIVKAEGSSLPDVPCHLLGFLIQYFLMSGFFWMSVICMEISTTFKFPKRILGDNCTNNKKFAFYNIFAMGFPLIVSIITIVMNYIPVHLYNEVFEPKIGQHSCWLDDESYAVVIYFYGPVGLVILFNFILFLREYFDFNCGRCRSNIKKYTFSLFLKMMMVMGIPWITEIISWRIGGDSSNWYFTDAINILRPIPIFIIFCCKPRVWNALKKKFQPRRQEIFTLNPREQS